MSRAGFWRALAITPVVVVMAWIATCSWLETSWERGFGQIQAGASEADVVAAMGEPSYRERRGEGFPRFASTSCEAPCARRLWYTTRLGFDIKAWSFELDDRRRVIQGASWTSP